MISNGQLRAGVRRRLFRSAAAIGTPTPTPTDIPILEPGAAWAGSINPANVPAESLVPYGAAFTSGGILQTDRRAVFSPAIPDEKLVDGVEYFTIDAETLADGGIDQVLGKCEDGEWAELPFGPHPVDGKYGWQFGIRAREGQDGWANAIFRLIPVNGLECVGVVPLLLKRSGSLTYADRYVDASAAPGGDGLTAGTAVQSLQAAINTLSLTDINTRIVRLFVAAGEYQWSVLQYGSGNALTYPPQILAEDFVGDIHDPDTVVPTKISAGFIVDSRFRHNLGTKPVYYENIEFDFGNAVRFPNGGTGRRCRLRQSLIGPSVPLHRPEFEGGHNRPIWEPTEIPAQTANFGAQPVSGVWGTGWTFYESDIELVAFDMVRRRWLNKEVCQMDINVYQSESATIRMDCDQTQVRNYEQRLHGPLEIELTGVTADGSNTRFTVAKEDCVYASDATRALSFAYTAGTTTLAVSNNPQPVVPFAASSADLTSSRCTWNAIRIWINGVPEERKITGVSNPLGNGNITLTVESPFSTGFSGQLPYEAYMLVGGENGQSYFRIFDPAVPVGNVDFPQMPDGSRQQRWHGYPIIGRDLATQTYTIGANPATVPLANGMAAQGFTIGHGDGGMGQVFPLINLLTSPTSPRLGILRRVRSISHSWQNGLPQAGWHTIRASPDANGWVTNSAASTGRSGNLNTTYGINASAAADSTTIMITNADPVARKVNFRVNDYLMVLLNGREEFRRIVNVVSQLEIEVAAPFPQAFTNETFHLSCSASDWIAADCIFDKAGQDYEAGAFSPSLYNTGWLRVTQPCATGVDVGMRAVNPNQYGPFDMWIRDSIVSGWTHDRAANDWPPELRFINTYFMLAAHFRTPDFMKPSGINPFIEGGTTQTVRGQNTQAGAAGYLPYPGIVTNTPTRADGVDINGTSREGSTLIGARIA